MKFLRRMIYYSKSVWEMMWQFKHWPDLFAFMLRRSSSEKKIIQLRSPSVQLVVRSAMDVWSVKETFLDAFYTKYGVPIQDGWTVIDIGAGIGDFSVYAAYGKPKTTIYAYEPFIDSYELLNENLRLNNIKNVNPFQIAIWSADGNLLLDDSSGEPLQITSNKTNLVGESLQKNIVQSKSLIAILDEHALEKVDLIKLDCEGAEYDVLMQAPSAVFDKIKRITMEYHDLDAEHSHQQLIPFLEDQGYHVQRFMNAVHDHIGYLFAVKE